MRCFIYLYLLICSTLCLAQKTNSMKDSISYETFKGILDQNGKHILGYIADVDRIAKTSRIYYASNTSDMFIETFNYEVNLSLYGDNHVTTTSKIYLFGSEESFLQSLNSKDFQEINNPNFKYRKILNDESLYKEIFLKELFDSLKLEIPEKLSQVNLEKFNKQLYDFGYDKAIKYLYFHLIIFCGEYINELENYQGKWQMYEDSHFPLLSIPEFICADGISTRVSLNHFLSGDLRKASKKNEAKKGYIYHIEDALNFSSVWQKFRKNMIIKKANK